MLETLRYSITFGNQKYTLFTEGTTFRQNEDPIQLNM